MSARAWRGGKRAYPAIVYDVPVDWWAPETLLYGPPPRLTRLELARRRRVATSMRRVKRRAHRHGIRPPAPEVPSALLAMVESLSRLRVSMIHTQASAEALSGVWGRPVEDTVPL